VLLLLPSGRRAGVLRHRLPGGRPGNPEADPRAAAGGRGHRSPSSRAARPRLRACAGPRSTRWRLAFPTRISARRHPDLRRPRADPAPADRRGRRPAAGRLRRLRLADTEVPGTFDPPPGGHLAGAWYRRQFPVPADWLDHSSLKFASADYVADVWLNGRYLGYHEGGRTPSPSTRLRPWSEPRRTRCGPRRPARAWARAGRRAWGLTDCGTTVGSPCRVAGGGAGVVGRASGRGSPPGRGGHPDGRPEPGLEGG